MNEIFPVEFLVRGVDFFTAADRRIADIFSAADILRTVPTTGVFPFPNIAV